MFLMKCSWVHCKYRTLLYYIRSIIFYLNGNKAPGLAKSLGYQVDIDHPKSLNEKINYRMKYGQLKALSQYADKYRVRDYVRKTIGDEYLIPLYGFYKKLRRSDLEELPNQFVIKSNHGSGYPFMDIVKDKSECNLNKMIKDMNRSLTIPFGHYEKHYRYINRGLLIEKYLEGILVTWLIISFIVLMDGLL